MKLHMRLFCTSFGVAAVALVLSFLPAADAARPVRRWTFPELLEAADVVIIGTVESFEDVTGVELNSEEPYIPVRCRLRVDAVTKGEAQEDVLTVWLFRSMTYREYLDAGGEEMTFGPIDIPLDGPVPVINGPRFAYESLREAVSEQAENESEHAFPWESQRFVLFLKVRADGDYEPVSGWTDSVDSVFRLDRAGS